MLFKITTDLRDRQYLICFKCGHRSYNPKDIELKRCPQCGILTEIKDMETGWKKPI